MNFKKELSPSKPLLYSTQSPILRFDVINQQILFGMVVFERG